MIPANFSVDPYLKLRYDQDDFNCYHFTDKVWFDLKGERIADRLKALYEKTGDLRRLIPGVKAFEKLDRPEEPSIVWLRYPGVVHMGVYLRGRILHISRKSGVLFQRPCFVTRGYAKVVYYK